MIGLNEFRERMKAEIEKTRLMKSVQVSGRNLDDALKQASLELGLPLRVIDYEVLEKGRAGFLGSKGTPWRLIAYESQKTVRIKEEKSLEDELNLSSYESEDVPVSNDANGRFSVRLASDGVWLKVFPPVGEGMPVDSDDVISALRDRYITDPDMDMVHATLDQADGMWIHVGEFVYNPGNDALCTLEVTEEGMKAYIKILEPGLGGADLTSDDVRGFLSNNSIVYGIIDSALQEIEDFPIFDTPILVAAGTPPVNGADAKVLYNFETESDKIHIQEREDGSVDFKELNKIQNVVQGQPLARKVPPEPGRDGRTVHGRYITARNGNDLEIGLGKNVTITDNGATVVATASGHVMLKSGKITVETVLVIPGNVDARTGNVNALGSVEVKGNVEDGFSVTAQGKIDVAGYVGKANLDAGGDIYVSRGINGGEGEEFGIITSGKTIWSSFIQNARVSAGEFVIVSAGIVNSDVVAQKKVLCKGRRAKIVGGHVRASEEVNAIILGSPGGTETLIEVGFDPRIKDEIEQLNQQRIAVETQKDGVDTNLQGLKRQVRMQRRRLSKEKEQLFEELRLQHNNLHKKLEKIDEEIKRKQEYLESLVLNGKISAAKRVLAGVTLRIRDVEYFVKESYENPVTFILDDNYIRQVKFQDIEEDLLRR